MRPDQPYIAFELVSGGGLNRLLRESVLQPRPAAALVETLARTMQMVHDQGVVHRDLKPANVLLAVVSDQWPVVSKDKARGAASLLTTDHWPLTIVPKITDFGLACLLDEEDGLSRTGQVLGTPGYMAPEQADGRRWEIGPATDIHALGAILYECLTGRPPFKGASLHETLALVCEQAPVPVRRLRPDVPRDLETICLKCLHKAPAKRYASAAELADDLSRFQQGQPIRARPMSRLERGWRWCRRQPLLAALTAACCLLAASLLCGAGWYASQMAAAKSAVQTAAAAVDEAREVAATQEYFALLHANRERASLLEPGWPSAGLAGLQHAAGLPTRAIDKLALRSEAGRCLGAIDLRRAKDSRGVHGQPDGAPSPAAVAGGRPGQGISFLRGRSRGSAEREDPATPVAAVQQVLERQPSRTRRRHRFGLQSGRPLAAGRLALRVVASLGPDAAVVRADFLEGAPRDDRRPAVRPGRGRPVLGGRPDRQALVRRRQLERNASACRLWASGPGRSAGFAAGDRSSSAPSDIASGLAAAASADADSRATAAVLRAGPVVIADRASLFLLDPAAGRITQTLRRPGSEWADEGEIEDVDISPDGLVLASLSKQTRHVRLWETASGRMLADLPLVEGVAQVGFAAAGCTLALLTGREVHLHELHGFQVQTFAALHAWPVLACTWVGKEGGLACLAGNRLERQGELSLWPNASRTAPEWRSPMRLPMTRQSVRLDADAAGKWLAFTEGDGLRVFPVDRSREGATAVAEVESLAFAPNGGLWVAGGLRVQARTLPGLRVGASWNNTLGDLVTGLGTQWAVAPGRRRVLAGGRDGCLRMLDARTGELLDSWRMCTSPIRSVALSADEQLGLVGTWKGGVRLVRLPDGERIDLPGQHRDRVEAVAFLGPGRFASGSADGTVRLYRFDGRTASEWLTLRLQGSVQALSASPDGERLALLLAGERAVRIWDLKQLRERLEQMELE